MPLRTPHSPTGTRTLGESHRPPSAAPHPISDPRGDSSQPQVQAPAGMPHPPAAHAVLPGRHPSKPPPWPPPPPGTHELPAAQSPHGSQSALYLSNVASGNFTPEGRSSPRPHRTHPRKRGL